MQESCREVSGDRVQGVEARDMETSKGYRKDPATGHRAEAQAKTDNKFATVGMYKKLVNKRTSPF